MRVEGVLLGSTLARRGPMSQRPTLRPLTRSALFRWRQPWHRTTNGGLQQTPRRPRRQRPAHRSIICQARRDGRVRDQPPTADLLGIEPAGGHELAHPTRIHTQSLRSISDGQHSHSSRVFTREVYPNSYLASPRVKCTHRVTQSGTFVERSTLAGPIARQPRRLRFNRRRLRYRHCRTDRVRPAKAAGRRLATGEARATPMVLVPIGGFLHADHVVERGDPDVTEMRVEVAVEHDEMLHTVGWERPHQAIEIMPLRRIDVVTGEQDLDRLLARLMSPHAGTSSDQLRVLECMLSERQVLTRPPQPSPRRGYQAARASSRPSRNATRTTPGVLAWTASRASSVTITSTETGRSDNSRSTRTASS